MSTREEAFCRPFDETSCCVADGLRSAHRPRVDVARSLHSRLAPCPGRRSGREGGGDQPGVSGRRGNTSARVLAAAVALIVGAGEGLVAQQAANPSDERAFHATVSIDNSIQTEFGDWQAKFRLTGSNLFRKGDAFYVEPSVLKEKWPNGVMTGYTLPIGSRGMTASLQYLKADFMFLGTSPLAGLQNDITYTILQVSRPLVFTQTKMISLSFGGVRSTSAYVMDENQFGETETVTLLTLGAMGMFGTPGLRLTNAFVQFSTNFHRADDSPTSNGEAGRLDLVAGHERWFTPDLSLFLFGIAAFSIDPLPLSHKVTIGGPFCVRGYNVNEAIGDRGFLVKAELRRRFALPKIGPVTVRAMLDQAGVKRKVPDATGSDSDYLLGGGVGATMAMAGRFSLSLDWAFPLNDHPVRDGKDNGRVWFTITTTY